MRVLWTVNVLPPQVAKQMGERTGHAISWVDAMKDGLAEFDDVTLAIAAGGHCKTVQKTELDGTIYYIYNKHIGLEKSWKEIIDDFQPDIIHAYGTEEKHNIPLISRYKDTIPIVISLQGIIEQYKRRYLGGLPLHEILANYTVKDLVFRNGIFAGRKRFYRQAKREAWMLRNVRYVEGRSDWDRAMSIEINPGLSYHYCPRMIRAPFFNYRWNRDSCEKHSIFVHQGNYPIKGMHFMLDALAILRRYYPDVKLYVSGANILSNTGIKSTLRTSGYSRLISKRIRKQRLEDCVTFTGYLNADQLAKKLTEVELCVVPSVIENAPNALAEAMLVGVPCIASDVGGNADMLNYGQSGLLYCHDEPELLASRIMRMFASAELEQTMADNAYQTARCRHDPADLPNRLIGIYRQIIADFREQ